MLAAFNRERLAKPRTFYRKTNRRNVLQITYVDADRLDYVEYEIIEGTGTYEVQIDLDKKSGKATKVDVAPNIWHAERLTRLCRKRRSASALRQL